MPSTKQDTDFSKLMEENIDTVKVSNTALDNAIEWIGDNLEPEDVFSKANLELWAESNGYVKE